MNTKQGTGHAKAWTPYAGVMVALLMLAALCRGAAMGATYYIDYAGGTDANAGTSTNAAWQRCPVMPGFSGKYAHTAGDAFIFKGGVTWPAAVMGLNLTAGGTAANHDYYGVSQNYFAGSAWSRAIFDGGGTTPVLININQAAANVTIDGLDIRGERATATFINGSINIGGTINVTITNCWVHKWSHGSLGQDGQFGGILNNPAGIGAPLTGLLITHCDIGNPDGDGNSGTCLYYPGEVAFCKIHDAPEGILHGAWSTHDTEFYNIVNSFDGSAHPNMAYLDSWNGGQPVTGPCYFYNNYIHGTIVGETIYPVNSVSSASGSASWFIYNNVQIGSTVETIEIDPYLANGAAMNLWIYNNTFNTPGIQINVVGRPTPPKSITYFNNVLINGSGPNLGGSVSSGNNIQTTESVANAAGLTAANFYQPPSANALGVAAGANLTSAGWPALTNDTSRGGNVQTKARPASGAWTIGAYQFGAATNTNSVLVLPKPPTRITIKAGS